MFEIIGWVGAIALAVCALPQVVLTWRTNNVAGLSLLFLFFWSVGEVLTLVYIVWVDAAKDVLQMPLYFNYGFNILMVLYLLYAKLKYKKIKE